MESWLSFGGPGISLGTISASYGPGFGGRTRATRPSSIRRTVCLSEAMYEGESQVEGVRSMRVGTLAELQGLLERWGPEGPVPVLADPGCSALGALRPLALVDAIIAKRNLGTNIDMAQVVVALGPGFEAGVDAHAVVETIAAMIWAESS